MQTAVQNKELGGVTHGEGGMGTEGTQGPSPAWSASGSRGLAPAQEARGSFPQARGIGSAKAENLE